MSLLSDTGRLRQVYRGSTEFFLVNSCGILHGFPRVRMYCPVSPGHSSEQGRRHPVRSSSLRDDSLEELFPPVIQVALGKTGGELAVLPLVTGCSRSALLFCGSTGIRGRLFTPGIAGGMVTSPRRSFC